MYKSCVNGQFVRGSNNITVFYSTGVRIKSSRTMAVFWRLVRMAPMPAKTPHLFCDVGSMPKHFLDATGRNAGQ